MLEETIVGAAVAMLILFFFLINYRFSTKGIE